MSIEERVLDYGKQQGVRADACKKIGELEDAVYYIYYRRRERKGMPPPGGGLPVVAVIKDKKIELLDLDESFEKVRLFDREK